LRLEQGVSVEGVGVWRVMGDTWETGCPAREEGREGWRVDALVVFVLDGAVCLSFELKSELVLARATPFFTHTCTHTYTHIHTYTHTHTHTHKDAGS
jgi:hypothetical protein